MAQQQTPMKTVLQKPPGYRDPRQLGQPIPSPPGRTPVVPRYRPKPPKRGGSCWRGCCRVCCCVFCAFVLLVVIVAALAGGVFYLIFDPRLPAFYLTSFQIPKFDAVSKPDGTHLDVQAITAVEVRNPNPKLDIYYSEGFDVYVSLGDQNDVALGLGSKEIKGFTQRHKNTTSFKVDAAARNRVVDPVLGRKLAGQYKSKDIKVRVEGKTRVGYVIQGWRVGTMPINVLCGGVSYKVVDGGDMPKCTINTLKWINIH